MARLAFIPAVAFEKSILPLDAGALNVKPPVASPAAKVVLPVARPKNTLIPEKNWLTDPSTASPAAQVPWATTQTVRGPPRVPLA